MLSRNRVFLLCFAILATARPAFASDFVYVAVPAAPCDGGARCAAPQLIVVDADTAAEVVRLTLPRHTTPVGMAISPDGRHLYISNLGTGPDGVSSMTVVDATRHTEIGTFPTGGAGPLAVAPDDSRVFVLMTHAATGGAVRPVLGLFDARAQSFDVSDVLTRASADDTFTIAAHPRLDILYVGAARCDAAGACGGTVEAYTASTLTSLGWTPIPNGPNRLTISADGDRLEVGTFADQRTAGQLMLDPASLTVTASEPADGQPAVALPGDPARRLLVATRDGRRVFVPMTDAGGGALVAADHLSGRILNTIRTGNEPSHLASTPAGADRCSYRLGAAFSSFAVRGGINQVALSTECAWQATSTAPWARVTGTSGLGTSTLDLTIDPNPEVSLRKATVTIGGQRVIVTQAGAVSQPPFGSFDTPTDGASGITGSVGVTGWALDDVGVTRVIIFRDNVPPEPLGLVLIGEATFVEGARPDVQALNATLPFAFRAGWGYLLLTNFLPGSGNGTVRLSAFAEDIEGTRTLLGVKRITVANQSATKPFGAIDTPAQGQEVSGTINNFGWVLTPQPANIPINGSTIGVFVDGVLVGRPTYNQFRSDIATLFPGFVNSNGAVGVFSLDTRTLADGVHTIAWVATDSLGRADGIGSRFFSVLNNPRTTLSSVAVNPSSIGGGGASTGTLTLSGPAPVGPGAANGAFVALTSSNSAVTVPAGLLIPAGSTSATFNITTTAIAATTPVTISAIYGTTTRTTTLTVIATAPTVTLASISLNPTSVTGGSTSQGTATLTGAAPAGGAVVTLQSNNGAATVPANVTVPAGATTANFTINTNTVSSSTPVTISGSFTGTTRQATLTVNPAGSTVTLSTISVNPTSVTAGTTSQGTATLTGAAPAGGAVVTLQSNNAAAAVPANVAVPAGATSATFTITTSSVAASTPVTISGTFTGTTKQATLTVVPPEPLVARFTVNGGTNACKANGSGVVDCLFDGGTSSGAVSWIWHWTLPNKDQVEPEKLVPTHTPVTGCGFFGASDGTHIVSMEVRLTVKDAQGNSASAGPTIVKITSDFPGACGIF